MSKNPQQNMGDWDLGPPPSTGIAPRFFSPQHSLAVGTYGPEATAFSAGRHLHSKRSDGTRWWQQLVLNRALEHDEDGRLVWSKVVLSTPRQSGKSWLERIVCDWRMHQAERWGEEQGILHVAHKLQAAQEVWRPAARTAAAAGARVQKRFGEQMTELPDGSRWMIQAANAGSGVSFSLSMALVDEAWRVGREVVDEAIGPTMAESVSPQLWVVSTAGTSSSDLMLTRRAAAIGELGEITASQMIAEWSAPPEADIHDPAVWRACSPFWDGRRESALSDAYRDATEHAFRQQWLNQWVAVESQSLDERLYSAAVTQDALFGPTSFAVEVTPDRSVATIVACAGGILDVVEERSGVAWVVPFVRDLVARHDAAAVVVDGLGPAANVGRDLADGLGHRVMLLNGREVALASARLFDAVTAEPPGVRIRHHESLHQAVLRGGQRRYGQTWAFARDVQGGVSGAPLAAAALALYASEHAPAEQVLETPTIW